MYVCACASTTQKRQMTKFTSAKLEKNISSKLYQTDNSKTRGQTEWTQMRWLIMSHLIWIYSVCEFNFFVSATLRILIRACLAPKKQRYKLDRCFHSFALPRTENPHNAMIAPVTNTIACAQNYTKQNCSMLDHYNVIPQNFRYKFLDNFR